MDECFKKLSLNDKLYLINEFLIQEIFVTAIFWEMGYPDMRITYEIKGHRKAFTRDVGIYQNRFKHWPTDNYDNIFIDITTASQEFKRLFNAG